MTPLDLSTFLPYRLSVLANRVSAQLARAYAEKFSLTIPEWRVMAVLGQFDGVTADFVCQRTEMDRVTVSRAVSSLRARRYVTRRVQRLDRRCSKLGLAAAGKAVYAQVVPLARRYEAALLAGLDAQVRAQLESVLGRLQEGIAALEADSNWRAPS